MKCSAEDCEGDSKVKSYCRLHYLRWWRYGSPYAQNRSTHGMSRHRLYRIWNGMRRRCLNSDDDAFPNYGGRGITICDGWRDSLATFCDWARSSGYDEHLTIDRIDNNGNYEPGNCRWATYKEQNNNRRGNCVLRYRGKIQTLAQWADELGWNRIILENRVRRGWSVQRTLTQRPRRSPKERLI